MFGFVCHCAVFRNKPHAFQNATIANFTSIYPYNVYKVADTETYTQFSSFDLISRKRKRQIQKPNFLILSLNVYYTDAVGKGERARVHTNSTLHPKWFGIENVAEIEEKNGKWQNIYWHKQYTHSHTVRLYRKRARARATHYTTHRWEMRRLWNETGKYLIYYVLHTFIAAPCFAMIARYIFYIK